MHNNKLVATAPFHEAPTGKRVTFIQQSLFFLRIAGKFRRNCSILEESGEILVGGRVVGKNSAWFQDGGRN